MLTYDVYRNHCEDADDLKTEQVSGNISKSPLHPLHLTFEAAGNPSDSHRSIKFMSTFTTSSLMDVYDKARVIDDQQ